MNSHTCIHPHIHTYMHATQLLKLDEFGAAQHTYIHTCIHTYIHTTQLLRLDELGAAYTYIHTYTHTYTAVEA